MRLFDHGVMTDENGLIKALRSTTQRGNPEPRGKGSSAARAAVLVSVTAPPGVHVLYLRRVYFNDAKKSQNFTI